MPRLALTLCVLGFVSLFVFRTVVQLRQTGSTGVKGFHGRIGSLPWLAGVAASLGLLLAPLGPIASLRAWSGGALLFTSEPINGVGALLAALGIVGALFAQLGMGASWRVGVDETETTALVTNGLFAWIRNPIFSFIWLSLAGLLLLVPNPISLLAAALTVIGIELQVRAVEEPYLASKHGDDYKHYAARVGRFVPGVGFLKHEPKRQTEYV